MNMSKQILIGIISCLLINPTFGQIKKHSINFSASFNGGKYGSVSGVQTSQITTFNTGFSIDSRIDYYFTDNLFIGVGFDFTKETKSVTNELILNNYYQGTYRTNHNLIYSPVIRFGWTKPIVDKLYASIAFNAAYSRLAQSTDDFSCEGKMIIPNFMSSTNIDKPIISPLTNSKTNNDLIGLSINPEIKYFLNKNFGISVGLGGFDYVIYDFQSQNNMWLLNLNPTNWKFGIEILF